MIPVFDKIVCPAPTRLFFRLPISNKLNFEFSLPEDCRIKLEIFSLAGQRVAVVFEGNVKGAELKKLEYNPAMNCDCMIIYRLQTEQGAYYGKAVMVR